VEDQQQLTTRTLLDEFYAFVGSGERFARTTCWASMEILLNYPWGASTWKNSRGVGHALPASASFELPESANRNNSGCGKLFAVSGAPWPKTMGKAVTVASSPPLQIKHIKFVISPGSFFTAAKKAPRHSQR
jgi:hypothetical protein